MKLHCKLLSILNLPTPIYIPSHVPFVSSLIPFTVLKFQLVFSPYNTIDVYIIIATQYINIHMYSSVRIVSFRSCDKFPFALLRI